jgi:putative hydrolase
MIPAADLLRQDTHVHSTFSDGAGTLAENIAEAERIGLLALTCVDHVRRDTDWVPDYVAAVRAARAHTKVVLRCAVEAKLLDITGALDAPADLDGVDDIYVADHQVPLADGPHNPRQIKALIEAGELDAQAMIEAIVTSTAAALGSRPQPMVIAHLFSILPKIGVAEDAVPEALLELLALAAARTGSSVEISERWSCPGARTLRPFMRQGVPIILSTDSHRCDTIGRYDYCARVLAELRPTGVSAA